MKRIFLIACFTFPTVLFAQEYYCPVNNSGGMNLKLDQWLIIRDSTISFKTNVKGEIKLLELKRVVSANPNLFYFTDGVVTSSLTFAELSGTIKGVKYSNTFTLTPNINQTGQVAIFYCNKIPAK